MNVIKMYIIDVLLQEKKKKKKVAKMYLCLQDHSEYNGLYEYQFCKVSYERISVLINHLRKVHPPFFHLAFLVSLPGFLRSLFSLISLHVI